MYISTYINKSRKQIFNYFVFPIPSVCSDGCGPIIITRFCLFSFSKGVYARGTHNSCATFGGVEASCIYTYTHHTRIQCVYTLELQSSCVSFARALYYYILYILPQYDAAADSYSGRLRLRK